MITTYDNILFDENGQPISLSQEEYIEYLQDCIYKLKYECCCLEQQLDNILTIIEYTKKVKFVVTPINL